jgi:hypothetical protein
LRPEYESRLRARSEALSRHERLFRNVGNWRLVIALAGAIVLWWNWYFLPVPVAAFIALIVYHERISNRITCEQRAIAFYQRALARLDNQWIGVGESGDRFRNSSHPYADDLDVFGRGSLFQLLSLARTTAGEALLARWLADPSPESEVVERQQAVTELQPRLDLREDLALIGQDIRAEVHPEALLKWGAAPPVPVPEWLRVMAAVLATCTAVACIGYMIQRWDSRPVLIMILIQSVFGFLMRGRVLKILAAAELPSEDMRLLSEVMARLEREPFTSVRLTELRRRLDMDGLPPSRRIARLQSLVERHEWSHNLGFRLFARLLLWSTRYAFAIERWRIANGPHISEWLDVIGEMEALSSLAGYASEHPADTFPEFAGAGPLFDATGMAHPLLSESTAVRNDVRLDSELQLLLVSGSNMSGKSTMLRAVGLNTVLAWAGAPVRARRLRISSLVIGASIRLQDSLQDGKSRFYSEITRLRQIMDMAGDRRNLLFLLDELLSGTNSHDRRMGAEALVRTLVQRGAIGLVTTHDLALSHIVETLAPRAANVHFEDHIENGRIAFDFIMRPGVVEKSNALELMRSVGLEV